MAPSFLRTGGKRGIDELCTGLFLQTIETPAVVMASYMGHALYTTPDVLHADMIPSDITAKRSSYLTQLEIGDMMHKDFKDTPLSKLFIQQKDQVNILSSRSMCAKDSLVTCDATGIFITTNGGRKHVSIDEYSKRARLDNPSAIIAMADEFNVTTAGTKRLSRAVMRTFNWLETLMTSSSSPLAPLPTMTMTNLSTNPTATLPATPSIPPIPFVFGVAIRNTHFPDAFPLDIKAILTKGARGICCGGYTCILYSYSIV